MQRYRCEVIASLRVTSAKGEQNTQLLTTWLDAKFYKSVYKPIPIEEYLVYDNSIYSASTSSSFFKTASQLNSTQSRLSPRATRSIQASECPALKNPLSNAVVSLAIETVRAGYGALIFCGGRQGCQSMAALVCEAMPSIEDVNDELLERREDVVSDLRSLAIGLDDTLGITVMRGVAFHRSCLDPLQIPDHVG